MEFNHVAHRLDTVHFDLVVEMLKSQLGFVELRRIPHAIWLRQPGATVDLQLTASTTTHRDHDKQRSQISFISPTPREELEKLAAWFNERGVAANVGAYSEREFYLDAPAAFVDFVIEAMGPELAEYDVQL
ncbi:MAG: hypothetical protein KC482_02655 [Dehalococcoidia bacterium]|nr:hypothetical protein [Dehalococcoidia bacterium]MCA9843266.1 hypothetical protein [Dehalococcoidia bacterium]MCA9852493.1 hypothetical protein [Dehalococcoidia bacterium]